MGLFGYAPAANPEEIAAAKVAWETAVANLQAYVNSIKDDAAIDSQKFSELTAAVTETGRKYHALKGHPTQGGGRRKSRKGSRSTRRHKRSAHRKSRRQQ